MKILVLHLLTCLATFINAQESTILETSDDGQGNPQPAIHNPPPERPLVDSYGLMVPLWSPMCRHEGLNRISSDCSHYHNCVAVDGYYRVFTYRCPGGFVFDERQASCAPISEVPECRTDNRDAVNTDVGNRPETRIVWNPVPPSVGPIYEDRPEVENEEKEEKEIEPITTERPGDETEDTELPPEESDSGSEGIADRNENLSPKNLTEGEQFWTREYKCPADGLQRHPKNCSKYYSCEKSHVKNMFVLSVFNCPTPLMFDQQRQICDWPQKVDDCMTVIVPTIPPLGSTPNEDELSSQETQSTAPPSSSTPFQRPPFRPNLKPGTVTRPPLQPVNRPGGINLKPSNTTNGNRPVIDVIIPPRPQLLRPVRFSYNNHGVKGVKGTKSVSRRGPFWSASNVHEYAVILNNPNQPKSPVKGKPMRPTPAVPIKGKPKPTPLPPVPTPESYPQPHPGHGQRPRPEKPHHKPHPHPQPEHPHYPEQEQEPIEQEPIRPPRPHPHPHPQPEHPHPQPERPNHHPHPHPQPEHPYPQPEHPNHHPHPHPQPEHPHPQPERPNHHPHPHPQPEHPYPQPEHPHHHPHPHPIPERPHLMCRNHGQFMADSHNCAKFYRCANGIVYEFLCPAGTLFDITLNVCNWPYNVYHPCGRPRDIEEEQINPVSKKLRPVSRRLSNRPSLVGKSSRQSNRQVVTQSQYYWLNNGQNVYTIPYNPLVQSSSYRTLYYDQNGNQLIILPQPQKKTYSDTYYLIGK